MDLVLGAREALRSVDEGADKSDKSDKAEETEKVKKVEKKEFYTDRDISGLGKNYMKEESRLKAIETYSFYLRNYALAGLKRELAFKIEAGIEISHDSLMTEETDNARWAHERQILLDEGLGSDFTQDLNDFKKGLSEYLSMQEEIARSVQASKEKDDIRGARIISDYATAHAPASEDDFVIQTWNELEELKKEVERLISALKNY